MWPSPPSICRALFILQNGNYLPIKQLTPHSPFLQPLKPPFYLLSLNLATLVPLYKWNRTGFIFLWLVWLNLMSFKFICVVACVRISFLLKGWIIFHFICHWFNGHEFEQTPGDGEGQGSLGHKELDTIEQLSNSISHNVSTTFCLSSHLFMVVWVASTFWLTNKAAVNMSVKISLQISALSTCGCIPRNGIAGLDGNSVFSFLRSHHALFHGDGTMLHFHQQWGRVSVSPFCTHACYFLFVDCCHPDGCEMVTN